MINIHVDINIKRKGKVLQHCYTHPPCLFFQLNSVFPHFWVITYNSFMKFVLWLHSSVFYPLLVVSDILLINFLLNEYFFVLIIITMYEISVTRRFNMRLHVSMLYHVLRFQINCSINFLFTKILVYFKHNDHVWNFHCIFLRNYKW